MFHVTSYYVPIHSIEGLFADASFTLVAFPGLLNLRSHVQNVASQKISRFCDAANALIIIDTLTHDAHSIAITTTKTEDTLWDIRRSMKERACKRSRLLIGTLLLCVWSFRHGHSILCFPLRSTALLFQPGTRTKTTSKGFTSTLVSLDMVSDSHKDEPYESCLPKNRDSDMHDKSNDAVMDAACSRRKALQGLASAGGIMLSSSLVAHAGIAELDSTGQLYSPKTEMLSGGSAAARGGIPVTGGRVRLKEGEALQSIYETRFVAYLSRFLLNFDPAARAWWTKQGLGESWEKGLRLDTTEDTSGQQSNPEEMAFAEFAESVEVGLADYFSGPFGSYGSISAARAGILAAQPAKSVQASERQGLIDRIFHRKGSKSSNTISDETLSLANQGVLNLYTLLKARYTSLAAKRQLAILFSFISTPDLQPVNEIRSILGEADNCTVSKVSLLLQEDGKSSSRRNEADSRTSPRRGGGYALGTFPRVKIDASPPLGDKYFDADVRAVMKPTTRVLSITVLDGGEGYTSAPVVTVLQSRIQRLCQASAILDREGHVESIIVLDPGYGYGGQTGEIAPKVKIEPPRRKENGNGLIKPRAAKAVADMEYKIASIDLLRGGNGYVSNEPPTITIPPPEEDPDWFLNVQEQPEMRMVPVNDIPHIQAEVTEMRYADGNVAFFSSVAPKPPRQVDMALIDRLQRDPLELIPSTVRPTLQRDPKTGKMLYSISSLFELSPFTKQTASTAEYLSPFYRAYDPVFGGVGRVPVTKGASALKASEYARLALSGAVCTVVVRTALNPLELIKTKQQLGNDEELWSFAQKRARSKATKVEESATFSAPQASELQSSPAVFMSNGTSAVAIQESVSVDTTASLSKKEHQTTKLGTVDLIQSTIELRGWKALFQSADITFLASLVFGSLGFGATELFRRSFGTVFFPEGEGSDTGKEVVLLLAASLATVVTAAVASPFEVLRVRSMGLLTPEKWTSVLEDFLVSENVNS